MLGTKRVLVVEDDDLVARGYSRLLQTRGYEVTVVGTVTSAVDELESSVSGAAYDYVVLDIRLPDGDGENVLVFAEGLPRPPFIVIVAAPMNLDARRFASLQGRCMYLPKPILIDMLVDAFERRPVALIKQYGVFHDFSEQEFATFEGAIAGLDDEDIAERIGCKPTTVRTYWSRIGEKTRTIGKDRILAHFARWLLARAVGGAQPERSITPQPESVQNVVRMPRPA